MEGLAFNWTTVGVAILNLLLGGVLVSLIKSRPAMRKLQNEREANLLHERAEEMAGMREELTKIREEMARMQLEHQKAQEAKDTVHAAERRADIHRINNVSQCLDALLMLIEQDPAKAQDAAAKVRKMRDEQLRRENEERAAIRAAAISAGHQTMSQVT